MFLLDVVGQEQTAVEVLDGAENLSSLGRSLFFGLGKPLKEQELQEPAEKPVLAGLLALGKFLRKVIQIAAVEEPLPLQEVDEHQAIQQHGSVPAALPLVANTLDQFDERKVLLLEVAVEAFGDPFDVEGVTDAGGDFDDAGVAFFVEFADVEDDLPELAHEEVARLALDIQVVSRVTLAGLAFDPVPEALRSGSVEEDQNVLVVLSENLLMDGRPSLGVGDHSAVGSDLEHDSPRKLGDLLPLETFTLYIEGSHLSRRGQRPSKLTDEKLVEIECP